MEKLHIFAAVNENIRCLKVDTRNSFIRSGGKEVITHK